MHHNRLRRWLDFSLGLRDRVSRLQNIVSKWEVAAIYTNTVTVLEGGLAAQRLGLPHIWHLREHAARSADLKSLIPPTWAAKIVGHLSDRVIFNSRALQSSYGDDIPSNKSSIVYNGIDLGEFAKGTESQRSATRIDLGAPENSKIVASIGSLTERKGFDTFIEVASELDKRRGDLFFVIVGDGDRTQREALERQAERCGIGGRFRILGWRDDVAEIISAFDLLLATARQEAFGRTLIEAMAANVPVVATRSGGPEEIIVDGESGFLAPVDDVMALAAASARLLESPELARKISRAGHERVEQMFSLDAYVQGIEAILLSTVTAPQCAERRHNA